MKESDQQALADVMGNQCNICSIHELTHENGQLYQLLMIFLEKYMDLFWLTSGGWETSILDIIEERGTARGDKKFSEENKKLLTEVFEGLIKKIKEKLPPFDKTLLTFRWEEEEKKLKERSNDNT